MTFSARWSGFGRDFPDLSTVVSRPIDTLSGEEAEHARHIGHLIEHYADERDEQQLSVSVTGWINPPGFSLGISEGGAAAPDAHHISSQPLAAAEEASAQELAPPAIDGGPGVVNPEIFPTLDPQGAPAVSDSNPFDPYPAGEPAPDPADGATEPVEPAAAPLDPEPAADPAPAATEEPADVPE